MMPSLSFPFSFSYFAWVLTVSLSPASDFLLDTTDVYSCDFRVLEQESGVVAP